MLKQLFVFFGLMMICIFMVYANALSSKPIPSISGSIETNVSVQQDTETYDENLDSIILELEYLHEEDQDKEVDGFIVETYREYEIYKDKEGNILKQVPTSNFNYLKYKK
ncbi:hypothetical protein ACFYKX_13060 [Cytobacillus sp. FJAT-54145]|uniref:Uncharacterized protein n=1 Tax=Cytobacillus spartinae TaxID=3299023 RepID=A0ABW6KD77_9BACI